MKKFFAALFLFSALAVIPVFAQEAGNKAAESAESGGEKPGMDVWKWINFAILAGVLGWLISKNLGPMLVTRSLQIQEGLAAGGKAKAEADVRAASVETKLASLGQVVSQMKASAHDERDREVERIRQDTQNELARIEQQAGQEIEFLGKLARLELQRSAAKLAIDLAEQKVRARMSPEVQAALANNFIGEMSDGAPQLVS